MGLMVRAIVGDPWLHLHLLELASEVVHRLGEAGFDLSVWSPLFGLVADSCLYCWLKEACC